MAKVFNLVQGGGSGVELDSIYIESPPTKTQYLQGETFDPAGMVVKGKYLNDEGVIFEATITGYAFSPDGGLPDGTTAVSIIYTEAGITKTASQPVTVIHRLQSIAVQTMPTKTSYEWQDTLNTAGLVIKATYSDGATANVNGTCSPTALNTIGTQAITVTYTERGVTKTTSFNVTVNRKTIQVPSSPSALTYNGNAQSPTWTGYDSAKMSVTGNSGTNAGNYTAQFTPEVHYRWPDGTTTAKGVAWSIAKAAGSLSISPTVINLSPSALSGQITVTRAGDGAISAVSNNTGVATVSVNGNVVTVHSVNNATGNAVITVSVAGGTNYTAPGNKTCQVNAQFVQVYGVSWNYGASGTALTRLTAANDPNGLVNSNITANPVAAVGTGGGSSPFDNCMPWKDMDEYNIVNNAVGARRGQAGFSRGNDTVVYIPAFYVRVINSGSVRYFYISDTPKDGFIKHPGSGKYVGRYNTSAGYVSKTGAAPLVSITRAAARTGSKGKGAKWSQYDYASWCAVWLLYLVEFADWNSQAKIGRGWVDGNSAAINSGGTDSMAYHTGRAAGTDGKTAVQYRHIENPWGNVFDWIDGINFNGGTVYVCTNPASYADDTSSGYTNIGTKAQSDGYIKSLGMSANTPWAFYPSAVGGSETTYVPDYAYYDDGWRVLEVGGDWNDGGKAGLFFFNAYYTASYSYASVGARLLFHP